MLQLLQYCNYIIIVMQIKLMLLLLLLLRKNTAVITIRNISIKTSDGKLYLFLVFLLLSSET